MAAEWGLRWRLEAALSQANTMIKTVEATIDEQGNVRLIEPIDRRTARRALVTIFEESALPNRLQRLRCSVRLRSPRNGIGRKRMKRSRACNTCCGSRPLSVFRPLTVQAPACGARNAGRVDPNSLPGYE